ncbi:MAG: nuclear transport factor 2 family protein [Chitinophaga sp.]|uniref:nuclear transport factor 2 family protein n=1 Tax=Chitinophaga sp. TaxID=1869181 RepID=UPI001B1965F7|nr:nuclear transport factor 2 family protein [Chitinophaga sp.]MBO9727109.1 nuclear transport factor 2 family protein [Chitinophaga sp.]
MNEAIETISEIYKAFAQGNVGKILSLLGENFVIHLPKSLGGKHYGRGGILEVVSKMCGTNNRLVKVITKSIEVEDSVIVFGHIELPEEIFHRQIVPYIDVWRSQDNRLIEVQVFYLDVEYINEYSNYIMKEH